MMLCPRGSASLSLSAFAPAASSLPMGQPGRLFFFQAEDGIRDLTVTGVQTCALPISDRDLWRLRLAGATSSDSHRDGDCGNDEDGSDTPPSKPCDPWTSQSLRTPLRLVDRKSVV